MGDLSEGPVADHKGLELLFDDVCRNAVVQHFDDPVVSFGPLWVPPVSVTVATLASFAYATVVYGGIPVLPYVFWLPVLVAVWWHGFYVKMRRARYLGFMVRVCLVRMYDEVLKLYPLPEDIPEQGYAPRPWHEAYALLQELKAGDVRMSADIRMDDSAVCRNIRRIGVKPDSNGVRSFVHSYSHLHDMHQWFQSRMMGLEELNQQVVKARAA